MKQTITYIRQCKSCGEKKTYIMRDDNVNSDLTDKDMNFIILNKKSAPDQFDFCAHCNMETKQEIIAFDY